MPHRLAAGSLLVLASCVIGCAAHLTEVDGYEAEYVDAPPNIETYPRYEFRDGYAYNVNGRWYHRHGPQWVRYSRPPQEFQHR